MAGRLGAIHHATVARLPGNANARGETEADSTAALSLSALDKLDGAGQPGHAPGHSSGADAAGGLAQDSTRMHAHNGFAAEFTHASEHRARAGDLAAHICAVLLDHAVANDMLLLLSVKGTRLLKNSLAGGLVA